MRMSAVAGVILSLALGCASSAVSVTTRDDGAAFEGQWSSGTLEGIGPVSKDKPECLMTSITERRLRLTREPGSDKIEGEWVRWTRNMWVTTDNLRCRWFTEDPRFEPMFQAMWVFVLDGTYDAATQSLRLDGTYKQCDGIACSRWVTPATTKSFKTTLRIRDGVLVDTNTTPDSADDVQFLRISDEAEFASDARMALDAALRHIDADEFEAFYERATSTEFRRNASREQTMQALTAMRRAFGPLKSRKFLNTAYLLYTPAISKERRDSILFTNGVFSDRTHGGEYMLLVKEAGAWKVSWWQYGS